MDSFKKVRGITFQLYFKHNSKDVWNLISAPNHLNLFHPFCKKKFDYFLGRILAYRHARIFKWIKIY